MNFNEGYASVYDALYQDKDYGAECEFLEDIFTRYARPPVCTILDLGCGTGGHALLLGEGGYFVTGVDRSEAMLSEARQKAEAQVPISCVFVQGDICDIDLSHIFDVFDAVIAMFAVISYQTTNEDLAAAFHTAWRHLEPGGLFVFDCWFGPAVLAERPTDRYRIAERGNERVVRFASSTLDVLQHTVQVDYKVLQLKGDRVLGGAEESHLVRFLFPKEIEYYLSEAGFKLLGLCPFMVPEQEATEHDWNITVIARKMEAQ